MFYLNLNNVLIVLSYQFLLVFQHSVGEYYQPKISDEKNCVYFVPTKYNNWSIPFTQDRTDPKIIHPDTNGNIILKSNTIFKMTCTLGLYFLPPIRSVYSEITVKCLKGSLVEYNDEVFNYTQFQCTHIPRPKLKVTNTTCQTEHGKVIETGFFTKSAFLLVFSICYDFKHKNTLYSWYVRQAPYYMRRQTTSIRPDFQRTSLFGVDVNSLYKNQNMTLEKILGSKSIIPKYIKPEIEFLTRGHLVARTEFNYYFEQLATFFYENTTPQWNTFNQGTWRSLENFLRKSLSKGNFKHLIVSGTHNTCMLNNENGDPKPLFLYLPNSLRVPQFIWKMDYNMDTGTGLVFVGLNNPYMRINQSVFICTQILCPGGTKLVNIFGRGLLYCCTKNSFEKAHGKLDEVVYQHA